MRALGCLLLLLTAFPVRAQFAGPTVWASAGLGFYSWTTEAVFTDENVAGNLSVSVASPRWMLQGGLQVVRSFELIGPVDPFPALSAGPEEDDPSYHTLYAMGGPWTQSTWFMAGFTVGPALTWGTRVREIRSPPCPTDEPLCLDDFPIVERRHERYLSPGLAGSLHGFVRLDGRVWLGSEAMLVANTSSVHVAPRFALRVDLLRPDR